MQMDEAPPEDAVKRRYRRLACLADKARRTARAFCAACHARLAATTRDKKSKPAAPSGKQQSRDSVANSRAVGGGGSRPPVQTQALREFQNRLRAECRVIDDCLRANADVARRRQSFPLFDPSDRQRFPDYPHVRPPPLSPFAGRRWIRNRGGCCESPVYQARTRREDEESSLI